MFYEAGEAGRRGGCPKGAQDAPVTSSAVVCSTPSSRVESVAFVSVVTGTCLGAFGRDLMDCIFFESMPSLGVS